MFHDISPEMAGLVSNWVTTLLYGIVVVLYIVCMYVLIERKDDRNTTATCILIGTSTVQFILSTIYVAVALRLLIEGFIHTENVPNGAFLYWINPALKSQVTAKSVYVTNTIVGDCVLIWRTYMVWGKNIYVCIFPITTMLGSAVTGYMAVTRLAQITGNLQPKSLFDILNWILSTWCLSMATQLMSTGLIAGRIWWHAKRNAVSKSRYLSLIVIVVESGAIFTLSTGFLLAFAELKTQAGAILGDTATQIATIAPTLIIIRVELNRRKAMDTLGDTGKKHVLVTPPMSFGSGHRPQDSSTQATVSTLSASDSAQELKCSV